VMRRRPCLPSRQAFLTTRRRCSSDFRLELVAIPVTDVDRAKTFYADQVGFIADHDHTVSEEIRFVQLTPPGSACSIAFGTGLVDSEPGSARGLQRTVADAHGARAELASPGVEVRKVTEFPWGRQQEPAETAARYRRDPDSGRRQSRLLQRKSPLARGGSCIAGAGFEPATFGL
jgi:catechol 2,3-dioxygenase-like lactoylglutathione lyase family enzyme